MSKTSGLAIEERQKAVTKPGTKHLSSSKLDDLTYKRDKHRDIKTIKLLMFHPH